MIAALHAIARLDDGMPLPGDREIADVFDRHSSWEHLRLDDVRHQHELSDWLADQCPACEDGGRGPLCDDCRIDGAA